MERITATLGDGFRFAESHHRRITDRAVSLGVRAALLLRSASGEADCEPEIQAYSLLLREREYAAAAAEEAEPPDACMEAAVGALERRRG